MMSDPMTDEDLPFKVVTDVNQAADMRNHS
jgi:hypothetical protein